MRDDFVKSRPCPNASAAHHTRQTGQPLTAAEKGGIAVFVVFFVAVLVLTISNGVQSWAESYGTWWQKTINIFGNWLILLGFFVVFLLGYRWKVRNQRRDASKLERAH